MEKIMGELDTDFLDRVYVHMIQKKKCFWEIAKPLLLTLIDDSGLKGNFTSKDVNGIIHEFEEVIKDLKIKKKEVFEKNVVK